jgi:phage tail sheath gpL-like
MPISFDQIPANWRMPLYWVEVDESQAGRPIVRQPGLIVGSMIAATPAPPVGVVAGTAVPDVPKPIGTQSQADNEYGPGSELASMVRAWLANNFAQELWCLPVLPLAGSVAATGQIVITNIPYEAGMFNLYIAGHYVGVVVGTTDTKANVATNLSEAINEQIDLPVYATVGTGAPPSTETVTLRCKTPGINGNDITLQANYYGKVGGQTFPPGFTATIPPFLSGGAGIPNFDNAISNLGEREFDYVALPNTDSNTLFDWELEYGFSDTGRWGH